MSDNGRFFNLTRKFNNDIANSISGVKSGSSILSEISRFIPKKMELTSLHIQESNIILKAKAPYTNGISIANVFLLRLNNSSFFKDNEVIKLAKHCHLIKKYYIETDEFDKKHRKLLNLQSYNYCLLVQILLTLLLVNHLLMTIQAFAYQFFH